MQKLLALSVFVAIICQTSAAWPAEEEPDGRIASPEGGAAICIHPSIPLLLVRGYEESLGDALAENALTEEEQEEFLVEFQANMAVKQAKLDVLRAIHQLEAVEKRCKGTSLGDEATQLLKLLPQRKDLQPGQPAPVTVARKRANVARRARVAPADATTVK